MNTKQQVIPFINLQGQYQQYKKEILHEITEVLDSSSYIMGPKVSELEEALANYVGRNYCLSCSSGTDSLIMMLLALEVGPGDEVIVPAFTFFATAEVVSFVGAVPVFVDVLSETYTMDPQKLKFAISPNTKAIIPVSLFGQIYQHKEIALIAEEHGIPVIEDGAQSFGAVSEGEKSLSFGIAGCTSFFPAKPLGAYGDGGAVFVDDEGLHKKLQTLRNHGQSRRYLHDSIGINGRLDSIQAAVLLVKLKYYDDDLNSRLKVSQRYFEGLADLYNITLPYIKPDNRSVFAQYTILVSDRTSFTSWMADNNIPVAIHYPVPLYRQPVYLSLGYNSKDFPVSEHLSECVVSLPFSPFLSEKDQDRIINTIKDWKKDN